VVAALDDGDPEVSRMAKLAAKVLKLDLGEKAARPKGALIASLKPDEVVAKVLEIEGDPSLGEQLFTRQICITCHTVSQDEPQRGPYLGNIAQTYPREELAWAVLDPNKTIAQGFATNVFTLKDGTSAMGFVTLEAPDTVTIRDIAGQESTFAVADIQDRTNLPTSMMPPGLAAGLTVREFAGLLAYLEKLSGK
jgi:putative heme-binding domain-containing protein